MTHTQRIIAVGGGKGGVGKSLVAANLGLALARAGRKVIVVDADLGSANLHSVLGLAPPEQTLGDFISHKVESLSELVVDSGFANLSLLSGARDNAEISNPMHQQKQRLLRHLGKLPCQDLILDLGAGTSYNVLDFLLLAQHGLLVVTPEPTAQENAQRFIKAATLRLLRSVQKVYGLQHLLKEAAAYKKATAGLHTAMDLVDGVRALEPQAGKLLDDELRAFRPSVVINQSQDEADRLEGQRFAQDLERGLGLRLHKVVHIPFDPQVRKSLRAGRPLLFDAPNCPAAQAISGLAKDFLPMDADQEKLSSQASAGRRVLLTQLIEVEEQEQEQRIQSLISPSSLPAQQGHSKDPSAGYDGDSLRAIREARGLSLETLAYNTKIPMSQLRAIEAEQFTAFAARVYLRGFLLAYARQLGLDDARVLADYLALYDRAQSEPKMTR